MLGALAQGDKVKRGRGKERQVEKTNKKLRSIRDVSINKGKKATLLAVLQANLIGQEASS